jgi:hypothetical protein
MRFVAVAFGLLAMTGCAQDSKWNFLRHSPDNARVAVENPTQAELVAYLNRNAQQIQSIECRMLSMDTRMGFQQFNIPGRMVCEKPRNFRLVAETLGSKEADIGSNPQEFWYYLKRNDPPLLVHCSYQDFEHGVRMPFPFQPEWVMEALGLAEYNPADRYVLTQSRKGFELVKEINYQGQRVQKVTVFSRTPSRVQVTDHILRDAKGNKICEAHIDEVANIGNVVLPRKIVLSYPAERLTIKLKLFDTPSDVVLNRPIDNEQSRDLFTRPVYNGVRTVDLANPYAATSDVRPAGGFLPQR